MPYDELQNTELSAEERAPTTPATPQEPNALESLQQALSSERERADANLAGWQRAAADLANYRKRVEQEKNDLIKSANAELVLRLLPVLDDLDRAFQTLPDTLSSLTWVQGIMLIDRKLRAVLEQEGLAPYESVGQEFDPAYHEAILQEECDPANDGKVLTELQKGYRFHDRVLRPAMVKVGRTRHA